jgi:zinc transporter
VGHIRFEAGRPPREITAGGIVDAIARRDVVTWLHFNLSDARARRWLLEASFLPTALREVLQEHNYNRDLATQLLELRTLWIKRLAGRMMGQLDEIEDELLAGSIRAQREHLGRARRLCARLRREFAPERSDLNRFLHRPDASSLAEGDRDLLSACSDALGFAIEEIAELYERAKLLQEELASRLAENTSRNLYVLSILTAVLLPMTLVTGIFGMNVAGLPGLSSQTSFWWVMLLILVSGAATLAILIWRKLL